MSLQIKAIHLYNREGNVRSLDFDLNDVNVIVGSHDSGKSTIINLIEYCSGRSSFEIEGLVRRYVAWCAVHFASEDQEIFVAKPIPESGAQSQTSAFMLRGQNLQPPPLEELRANTNDDGINAILVSILGISATLNQALPGSLRPPYTINYRHSSFYCYQTSSILASEHLLFFRQNEEWVKKALQETIAYFVGAVPVTRFEKYQRLASLKRQLKFVEREWFERDAIRQTQSTQLQSLVREASSLGLIADDMVGRSSEEALEALRTALSYSDLAETTIVDDDLADVRNAIDSYRSSIEQLERKRESLRSYNNEMVGYETSLHHHSNRLKSVNLLPRGSREPLCPLCSQPVENETDAVARMKMSLQAIEEKVLSVGGTLPRIREEIVNAEEGLREQNAQLNEAKVLLRLRQHNQDQLSIIRERENRIALVKGRISLYLESMGRLQADSSLDDRLSTLSSAVADLEAEVGDETEQERLDAAIHTVGLYMSEFARGLELAYIGHPYRLDLSVPTVLAETREGHISMARMSSKDILGCHLIAILALHKHFRLNDRPVPGFLILDRISGAFFPGQNVLDEGDDEEWRTLKVFLNFVYSTLRSIPNQQLILLEHANIQDSWYIDGKLEAHDWSSNDGLIPASWLTSEST